MSKARWSRELVGNRFKRACRNGVSRDTQVEYLEFLRKGKNFKGDQFEVKSR